MCNCAIIKIDRGLDVKPKKDLIKNASQPSFFRPPQSVVGFTGVLPATPFFTERNEK